MRIAFVDHSFHQKTRSSDFFRDLLATAGAVEVHWDETWNGGSEVDPRRILDGGYDLVVVWQVDWIVPHLTAHPNLLYVPMYDACRQCSDGFWRKVGGAKILSLCLRLHQEVSTRGLTSAYFQYFPEPPAEAVADYQTRRGFFWQRVAEPSWRTLDGLLGPTQLDSLHLHLVPDPDQPKLPPGPDFLARHNATATHWFERQDEFLAALKAANIFFAPRPYEGIGFALLEAMGLGMAVVAPDRPTMNEYVTHGVDGLLYDLDDPRPLDLGDIAALGRRARNRIIAGHERWLRDQDRLLAFALTPTARLDRRSLSIELWNRNAPAERRRADKPKVTIATVVLNAADTIEDTIQSVLSQEADFEYLILDGGSTDGTLDVIRRYEGAIDRWISEKDDGPYFAMNKAAQLANGDYILFMNAGDSFAGPDAITRAFRNAPEDADFVYGHHIYRRLDGVEQLHKANLFDDTWAALAEGRIDHRWLAGVPGHQAVFTRTDLLRRAGYDTGFRYAADHDFMYRSRQAGARFHHCGEVLAVYSSGGISWQNQLKCVDEWRRIAHKFGVAENVEPFFAGLTRRPGLVRRLAGLVLTVAPGLYGPLAKVRAVALHWRSRGTKQTLAMIARRSGAVGRLRRFIGL